MDREDLIVLLRYLANGNHKDVSIAHEAADVIENLVQIIDRLHEALSAISTLVERKEFDSIASRIEEAEKDGTKYRVTLDKE